MLQNRVRLQLDERRQRLLALGRTLFAGTPYDDITIDDIAKAAGISKGLLYHYFPSKRHFFIATMREAASELYRVTDPDRSLPSEQQLEQSLNGYLDFVDQHGPVFVMILRSGTGIDPEVSAIVEANRVAFAQRLFDFYGISRPPAILRQGVRGWIGFIEAAGVDRVDNRADVSRRRMLNLMMLSLQSTLEAVVRLDPRIAVQLRMA